MKDLSTIQRPWIDSIADRCRFVLQMPRDAHFAFRVATVAFVNAALLRYKKPECDCARWVSESDALDQLVEEHFRDSIRESLKSEGMLSHLVRAIFYRPTLPRSFAPWMELADKPTQAHWLIARATNLGLGAHLWIDDLAERLQVMGSTLIKTEQFISTRLHDWEVNGINPDEITIVEEFMTRAHYDSAYEANLMASLASVFPPLGSPDQPRWNVDTWLHAGWHAGKLLAKSPKLPELLQHTTQISLEYSRGLFEKLAGAPITWQTLRPGLQAYLVAEHIACPLPTLAAPQCVRAFDYGCWMQLQESGAADLRATLQPKKRVCPCRK
jgi:hypothetical protein